MTYLVFIGGVLLGLLLAQIRFRFIYSKGKLKIDQSNPEKDIYRFELDEPYDNKTKYFLLKVITTSDLSHE